MWKGSRFRDWNGEQFVSIWRITEFIWQITGLFRKSQVYLANLCGESLGFFWQITDLANHGCIWRITGLFGKSQIYLTNHGFIIWWITGLFDESRVCLKLNNSCTHSSVARFEVYLSTENQSWKCCWKQEEDGSGKILWSLLGCFL